MQRTHQQFIEEMGRINPNLEVLGVYTKVTERILVRCKILLALIGIALNL